MPVVVTLSTSLNNLYLCNHLQDFESGKFAPKGNTAERLLTSIQILTLQHKWEGNIICVSNSCRKNP